MTHYFNRINPTKEIEVAAVAPCPVLICAGQYGEMVADDLGVIALCYGIEIVRSGKRLLQYRGVALHRLPTILRTGRDAEPTDAVFWSADRIEKALEYGGREQVLLVYDPRRLTLAWVIVDAECPPTQCSEFERLYPTVVWEKEKSKKRSRSAASEYHDGIGYDAYANWIRGDPFDALILIITLAPPGCPLASEVRRMISECPEPKWKTGTPEEQAAVLARATDITRLSVRD